MFRVKIINHIIKFDVFFEMRHHVKFKNVEMFFFRFFVQESILAKNVFQNIYSKQCILWITQCQIIVNRILNQQNKIYNNLDEINRIWFFFCKKKNYDWHELLNNSSTICDCSLCDFIILFKIFHVWERRNNLKFFILYDFVRRTFAIIASFSLYKFIFNNIWNSLLQSFKHMIYNFFKQLMKNIKHDDAMNIQIMIFLCEILNIMQIIKINKLDVIFNLIFKLLSCWFMCMYFMKLLQIFFLL